MFQDFRSESVSASPSIPVTPPNLFRSLPCGCRPLVWYVRCC